MHPQDEAQLEYSSLHYIKLVASSKPTFYTARKLLIEFPPNSWLRFPKRH